MQQRDDNISLIDVLHAAQAILEFVKNKNEQAFLADDVTQSAVLHQFLILGEAASRISESFREEHPSIPWRAIIGLRNILIHQYQEVDLKIIWHLTEKQLPDLIKHIEPLLPQQIT